MGLPCPSSTTHVGASPTMVRTVTLMPVAGQHSSPLLHLGDTDTAPGLCTVHWHLLLQTDVQVCVQRDYGGDGGWKGHKGQTEEGIRGCCPAPEDQWGTREETMGNNGRGATLPNVAPGRHLPLAFHSFQAP